MKVCDCVTSLSLALYVILYFWRLLLSEEALIQVPCPLGKLSCPALRVWYIHIGVWGGEWHSLFHFVRMCQHPCFSFYPSSPPSSIFFWLCCSSHQFSAVIFKFNSRCFSFLLNKASTLFFQISPIKGLLIAEQSWLPAAWFHLAVQAIHFMETHT